MTRNPYMADAVRLRRRTRNFVNFHKLVANKRNRVEKVANQLFINHFMLNSFQSPQILNKHQALVQYSLKR